MSDTARLADQIRRAFEGEAWHGDSVLEILADVDAKTAAARPIPGAHSIWELVLHIEAWDRIAIRRAAGEAVDPTDAENFPPVIVTSQPAWRNALASLRGTHNNLVKAVAAFPDSRLQGRCRAKSRITIIFITCSAGSCSMSCITRDRSRY